MLNLRMIVIYLALLSFVATLAWLLSLLIKHEMQKRLDAQEERIKRLSATEEGKRILEEESEARTRKMKKWEPVLAVLLSFIWLIVLAAGIFGVYDFVTEISAGKRISKILFSDRGFYLISPIVIVYSVFQLINIVKAWFSSHKKSQNSATETNK